MQLIEIRKELQALVEPIVAKTMNDFLDNIDVTEEIKVHELTLKIQHICLSIKVHGLTLKIQHICLSELLATINDSNINFHDIYDAIKKWIAYGLDVKKNGIVICEALFDKISHSYKGVSFVFDPLIEAGVSEEQIIQAHGKNGEYIDECRWRALNAVRHKFEGKSFS